MITLSRKILGISEVDRVQNGEMDSEKENTDQKLENEAESVVFEKEVGKVLYKTEKKEEDESEVDPVQNGEIYSEKENIEQKLENESEVSENEVEKLLNKVEGKKEAENKSVTFDPNNEIPELRNNSPDSVEYLKSSLRRSQNITKSFKKGTVTDRQVSQEKQKITSEDEDFDNFEIISCLGGQDFSDLIDEYNTDKHVSTSPPESANASPNLGLPPPPPPAPVTPPPPPPPGLIRQAMQETRTVKLQWYPIRKEMIAGTVWEDLPKMNINKEEIRNLFSLSSVETKPEKKAPKMLNVLEMQRSNNINIAMKKFKFLNNIKNTDFDCFANEIVTKEEIEMLQRLYFDFPKVKEEINQIEEEVDTYPDIPLGSAEQFLLHVKNLPDLETKLSFYIFKLDFPDSKAFVCRSFRLLKDETEALKKNKEFSKLLSRVLETGRVLEKRDFFGFELDFLGNLDQIKDTVSDKSFLYHVLYKSAQSDHNSDIFSTNSHENLASISKCNFACNYGKDEKKKDEKKKDKFSLHRRLEELQEECGQILENLLPSHDPRMLTFMNEAQKQIVSMKRIQKMLLKDYSKFLAWLAIPSSNQSVFGPDRWAELMVQLAEDVKKTNKEIASKSKKKKTFKH
eukprot:GFUD01095839.1.p1 GENE.GFUD01095839.1~~GFUD01095839.1.p1  ORF type:complete len:626 (+),score=201.98 GFUD01095839.1:3-1880(+)